MDEECGWFLYCHNPAVGIVEHPILGQVPCCGDCAAKLDLDLELEVKDA